MSLAALTKLVKVVMAYRPKRKQPVQKRDGPKKRPTQRKSVKKRTKV
jgi:hypothetical protein